MNTAGFKYVVLLGMGGSSLGAEVINQTFRSAAEYPRLIVLDSILPEVVRSVAASIEPEKTLFIVSSKSGSTREPTILFKYFHTLVQKDVNRHFIAITDRDTSLHMMAEEDGFRRVFLNPSDIGGRYSVLSYFGLVPAALIGVDVNTLLDRAEKMRETCADGVPVVQNSGCQLAAFLGTLTLMGRDKMTIITSPSLSSFGLWLEQLIAESTGKNNKGIVPVADEPLMAPHYYGSDRMFVYIRMSGDNNAAADYAIDGIKKAGMPVYVTELKDKYDLGGEFFRWEFATAVTGYLLGINPFDQPDVQKAKSAMEEILRNYSLNRSMPSIDASSSVGELLRHAGSKDYFAIMAYLEQTFETDNIFKDLRKNIMEKYHLATTLGYGPRFLHSTGQLHKGGPNDGLFLQILTEHEHDIPIPDETITFGLAADAQAAGDFKVLKELQRRVVSIRITDTNFSELKSLVGEVSAAAGV